MLRLVVLVSGSGTNFADLLQRTKSGRVPAEIIAVGADRECGGLETAQAAGIPTFVEPFTAPREEWSMRIADRIAGFEPDLVVLSGFMRLLSSAAVARFEPAILNTHPAHLPEFPGAHGVRDALAAGVAESGATVIIVDSGVDTGPILAQQRVPVLPGDTQDVLHERIKLVERDLLARVVTHIADGTIDLADHGLEHRLDRSDSEGTQ
ncbi:formyltetrahydrofolate-dependent phosphoribosylglycinamide formyltransferase [Agrococcus baldri]|uniref:Phosphoribosylglycinamide formyltransferase n=1 Tax=Agrococcus baldri TaxID=153730 RepID=A0AA94HKT5_9MICO|nr:phosphoribosylglycinamide formyltransferase [Agrococcus baldri]SFS01923.1 formyltetrahydrofolate-dependent phosphoribosylglycinamide formyltransferase [Agrococcus baldri]